MTATIANQKQINIILQELSRNESATVFCFRLRVHFEFVIRLLPSVAGVSICSMGRRSNMSTIVSTKAATIKRTVIKSFADNREVCLEEHTTWLHLDAISCC
uniref:Uncharacterized protein n=1 Tax=Glossina palpalis gambiensis TaxID=67801 RepID=A0A1B0AVS3_9MUSC